MNPTAIYSKTGKGVQEASGKTSNLSRADRAVLKEIDGKTALGSIATKFEKIPADKFDALIAQFDKDGYVREVSSGSQPAAASPARSAPPPKAAPPPPAGDADDEMDFTQAIKLPPKAPPAAPKSPPMDLAAAARAETERKAKEEQAFDFKGRQETEVKAKAEAEKKSRAEAELRARALAEAKARAENEAKARAESETRTRAEAEAKVKAAREAAIRMATEVKAKAEAEGKARTDAAEGREREALEKARKESEDKARLEAELTGKLEQERKAREDAERRAREAADEARKEMEEKAKRDADELRQRLEAEMKAKLEEERKAREEEDRKRREEEDRKRQEEDARRRKEEEARRAKEEAERLAREEEDRKRREEDARRRKEEEEQRAKEAAERQAREEADRKRREEEDRKRAEEDKRRKEDAERRAKEDADRRAKEDADRRAKDDADRKAKEDAERKANEVADRRAKEDADRRAKDDANRKAKDDADRKAKEDADRRAKEDADRKARDEAESMAKSASVISSAVPSIEPVAPLPPAPSTPAPAGDIGDSLLADLDSFGQREEEEQKEKEAAERKAKQEAERKAKDEAERKAKAEAERRAKEEAEAKRREQQEREEKERAEQRARDEEERLEQEEAERKRKDKEALAAREKARKAAQRVAASKNTGDDDDIGVTDDDLDMDEVKKDEKALSGTARKAAREREQSTVVATGRPRKWGKPLAIALFVALIGGVGILQLMPMSTTDYEKAASEAIGATVKIGSARLSVITGIEARFEGVSIGDSVKITTVRAYPEVGSLFGAKKSFSRIELDGVALPQSQLAGALLGKVAGENFRVARILIKQAKFDGPFNLPALDVDATVSGDGSLQSVSLRGGDNMNVKLSPKGGDIGFEISAASLALPFAPALTLSEFGMKGTATRAGVTMSEFDGRAFDGTVGGSARIEWGANWVVDGEIRVRGVKVAVLAPALVSEGKVEGRGAYSMNGANPAKLFESARIQGLFKIEKGVLGSFDLTRALQTGGAQSGGRTIFTELTGQALYDKGTVKISNVAIAAGAMNAGASLDIDANGGLSGRVVADVKTPTQTLRATLNVSGKIQDPVIRK